ncbi:tRNA 2-selenouridine(34) synthase MnmH [Rugosibacter aromaticivorans]|uniref:tRNA 2-selenouridine(34) synthase MnmH n=1 Tax=Rugosibacter aromaticivorans TaxID=1565605 RepID=UPI000AC373AF|nr:tRNA 2-selenouridine(34) synthase MnmH [Rugosibacter aromaticivorans]TBR14700.1 MAG: tRNA 2-selenouridine(34) synthase MnmH [Rugosibacter sp.]
MHKRLVTVAQIAEFDAIIDVRSPSEFAEDHLPGAQNCPVLSDEERARVGTLYKQSSAFEARKIGAVLVSRNIAHMLETYFLDKPRQWRPLIVCWRGGQRSGAFSHVMREVGWDAYQLAGGYKAWRRHVLAELVTLPKKFDFRVISGATGSGKSQLLEALARQGAQVLHLESLAAHKGSVLGGLPGQQQSSQKSFETRLFCALNKFDPQQPVFVEAESRVIGKLRLPESLIAALRSARCLRLDVAFEARVDFLMTDYAYALHDIPWLLACLDKLHGLQSNDTLARWKRMAAAGDFRALVSELLQFHYDPLYQRSQLNHYAQHEGAQLISLATVLPPTLDAKAAEILAATDVARGVARIN